MADTAKCPHCGIEMAVPADLAGDDIECPGCGKAFRGPPPPIERLDNDDFERDYDDRPRRRRRRDPYDFDDFDRLSPRQRRIHAEGVLRPAATALLIVAILRLLVNGGCAVVCGGFAFGRGGFNPGTTVLLAVTALSFAFVAIIIFGAWMMLNCRSYGWGLTAGILMVIPFFDYMLWVFYVGFGVWAIVAINDSNVRWLIRQRQKQEHLMEQDHD